MHLSDQPVQPLNFRNRKTNFPSIKTDWIVSFTVIALQKPFEWHSVVSFLDLRSWSSKTKLQRPTSAHRTRRKMVGSLWPSWFAIVFCVAPDFKYVFVPSIRFELVPTCSSSIVDSLYDALNCDSSASLTLSSTSKEQSELLFWTALYNSGKSGTLLFRLLQLLLKDLGLWRRRTSPETLKKWLRRESWGKSKLYEEKLLHIIQCTACIISSIKKCFFQSFGQMNSSTSDLNDVICFTIFLSWHWGSDLLWWDGLTRLTGISTFDTWISSS